MVHFYLFLFIYLSLETLPSPRSFVGLSQAPWSHRRDGFGRMARAAWCPSVERVGCGRPAVVVSGSGRFSVVLRWCSVLAKSVLVFLTGKSYASGCVYFIIFCVAVSWC